MDTKVTLLRFAAFDTSKQLRGCLERLGYAVRELEGRAWIRQPDNNRRKIIALFEPPLMTRQLLSELAGNLESKLLLTVFPDDGSIDPKFLSIGAECAFWPCSGRELDYRLSRLERLAESEAESIDQPQPEVFAGLNLVGQAPVFQAALARVLRISRFDVPVLLHGETGTGKEVFARAIHYLGPRHDAAFVPINCGAIPAHLFESEFYGYARGAFTDAKSSQIGLVELADNGTLFLDEVDSLSQQGQVSLLRFLQSQEFRPIGSRCFKRVNVRVIAAGNRSLKRLVEDGSFREDLYYRLNLFPIELPSLRARQSDIALLARHFLDCFQQQYGMSQCGFSQDAVAWLCRHAWPGNVRELENVVHRACLVARHDVITARDLADENPGESPPPIDITATDDHSNLPFAVAKQQVLQEFERTYLEELLRKTRGNVSAAARLAGKERRALGKLLKKYGLCRQRFT